jgi:penicillin-binding protein 2
MVGRQRRSGYNSLLVDPKKPMINRAIGAAYPPGSTFKTAQGLIFLHEEVINPHTTSFSCYGGFVIPGLRVGCHAHGSPITLLPAVSTSCNAFFCWGLYRMIEHKKYESPSEALNIWRDHMVSMGFGYALGVDLPGEKRGLIPNAAFYDHVYGKGGWGGLRIIHTAIGQGEILLTPLQLANLAATIGNRGHFTTPHIVKEVQGGQLDPFYRTTRHTNIDPKYYDYIVQGMRGAVVGSAYGATCRAANIPDIEVCGKTGTVENRGVSHSAFMGFAPMDNPRIAVSVFVENAGWGASWGVPIGAILIEKYLKGEVTTPTLAGRIEDISNSNLIPYELQKH